VGGPVDPVDPCAYDDDKWEVEKGHFPVKVKESHHADRFTFGW